MTSTDSKLFENVQHEEVIVDSSLKDKGIKVGDTLTNNQFSGKFVVKGFVEQKKYSHAPVAYINNEDYKEIYRTDEMQLIFVPNGDSSKNLLGYNHFRIKSFLIQSQAIAQNKCL